MKSNIGLLDCNNFFVSCERLFRPDIVHKPVIVLSSNDGCVVARSQEVKDIGIPMGVPLFQIKDIVRKHDIVLFSSNFQLYQDISRRVMSALKDMCGECEQYSIDEAFFNVSAHVTEADMMAIQKQIIKKTGIPVSIGIAETKTRAKLASKYAKTRGGVCCINPAIWDEMKTYSCGVVWGIGRTFSEQLSKSGIRTIEDFMTLDRAYIRGMFGIVGERLLMELSGVRVYEVGCGNAHPMLESYTSTRSFGEIVRDKHILMQSLTFHATRVADRMRHDACVGSRIIVILQGSRHGLYAYHDKGDKKKVIQLSTPTNDPLVIIHHVQKNLDSVYDPNIPYKKSGIVVQDISPSDSVTVPLFTDNSDADNQRYIYDIADTLNTRFGKGKVMPAIMSGSSQKWREKRELLSPAYTTKWTEIPSVKAI